MRKTGAPRPPFSQSSEGVLRDAAGGGTREYMRLGCSAHGLERVEWRFVGQAFSPHRHDSYAIGLTLEGVQTFRYRGARRICLPGECHVLHPDELHDGGSGSAAPFAYRIAYVDPTLVQAQLGGSPLPFVTDPVMRLTDAQRRHLSPVWDMDDVLDEMALAEVGAAIADFLLETSGSRSPRTALPIAALERARALLYAEPATPHSAAELEGPQASTAGRSRGNSGRPSAPVRPATVRCDSSITCGARSVDTAHLQRHRTLPDSATRAT